MCDFFDDFGDFENDGSNDGFMDDDSFEDNLDEDLEMEEPCIDDAELEDKTNQPESPEDEFPVKDALIIGGSILWDLEEEAKEERRQRKREGSSDDLE